MRMQDYKLYASIGSNIDKIDNADSWQIDKMTKTSLAELGQAPPMSNFAGAFSWYFVSKSIWSLNKIAIANKFLS